MFIKGVSCTSLPTVLYNNRSCIQEISGCQPVQCQLPTQLSKVLCSQFERDVRVDAITEIFGDVLGVEIGVLDLVGEVLDDFEQNDPSGHELGDINGDPGATQRERSGDSSSTGRLIGGTTQFVPLLDFTALVLSLLECG